jgi:hypothetical protein
MATAGMMDGMCNIRGPGRSGWVRPLSSMAYLSVMSPDILRSAEPFVAKPRIGPQRAQRNLLRTLLKLDFMNADRATEACSAYVVVE